MSEPMEAAEHPWYHARVLELESEGCTTSDAQGVADVEYERIKKQLRAENAKLREALRDLEAITSLANARQHAGCDVRPDDWSEMFDCCAKARAVLDETA